MSSKPLYDIAVRRSTARRAASPTTPGTFSSSSTSPRSAARPRNTKVSSCSTRRAAIADLRSSAFPSNQFDGQEPGSNDEIAAFCRSVYGVQFPMFAKLDVKGPDQHPLYRLLTEAQPRRSLSPAVRQPEAGERDDVRWNFEKFLVSRDGEVVGRFDPDVTPGDAVLTGAIDAALASPR